MYEDRKQTGDEENREIVGMMKSTAGVRRECSARFPTVGTFPLSLSISSDVLYVVLSKFTDVYTQ